MSYVTKIRSRLRGREGAFWRPINRAAAKAIAYLARRYELDTKEKGRRNGSLGHIAVECITMLANLVDERTGRLEPSIDYLCQRLKRSKDAIVTALAALREHGFLEWIRRWVPSPDGWRAVQTSNAYRLTLPKGMRRRHVSLQAKPSMPDDEADRLAEVRREMKRYKGQLTADELVCFVFEADSELGKALRDLAKSHESARQAETSEHVYSMARSSAQNRQSSG